MSRTEALSGLAAALLAFWALMAVMDPPTVTPALQAPTEATDKPQRWQQPDPRTISRFPGP